MVRGPHVSLQWVNWIIEKADLTWDTFLKVGLEGKFGFSIHFLLLPLLLCSDVQYTSCKKKYCCKIYYLYYSDLVCIYSCYVPYVSLPIPILYYLLIYVLLLTFCLPFFFHLFNSMHRSLASFYYWQKQG